MNTTDKARMPMQWREGDSLEHWLETHRDSIRVFPVAVITAIDGIAGVSGLPSLISFGITPNLADPDRPVAVDVDTLLAMLDAGYFNGFDEVWLLEKPVDASRITRPPVKLHTAEYEAIPKPDELREWMQSIGATVGSGDGWGVLVVARDEETLERFSIST